MYCEKCFKEYTNIAYKWCKPCQINRLKENSTYRICKNEKIDEIIQDMQLKINYYDDIIFEWIPYNQFNDINNIKKESEFSSAIVYSAIWKDGPLYYDWNLKEYKRKSNINVALKSLCNSQKITNEFISEVRFYISYFMCFF